MPSLLGRIEGGRILFNAVVGPPGTAAAETQDFQSFRALLDTGANLSGVSSRLVEQLGLEPTGDVLPLIGIHGADDVPLYRVSLAVSISDDSGTVLRGEHSLEVSELSALDPDVVGFDVLLGMDLITRFHITICRDLFILSN